MTDRPGEGSHRLRRATASFRATPASASRARRFVARWCDAWSVSGVAADAEIVVTELVENAVRHTGHACEVDIGYDGSALTIRVTDFGRKPPRLQRPALDVPGGRGLLMVNNIASRWGYEATKSGKVVWADLAVPEYGTAMLGVDGTSEWAQGTR